MSIFILMIIFAYAVQIVIFCIGWRRLSNVPNLTTEAVEVSVVVAARNEACNICQLLDSLANQSYKNFELIVVDDHSSDDTLRLLTEFARLHSSDMRIKIASLTGDEVGKKSAIHRAVSLAACDWIVSTDADCRMSSDWLATLVGYFASDVNVVLAPVTFVEHSSILNQLFSLEFLSLVGSGAAMVGLGRPIYGNAANMCYRRCLLMSGNDVLHNQTASGDDVFLLHAAKRSGRVVYAHNRRAMVETLAPKTLSAFFSQRVRWASKSKTYRDVDTIVVAVITLLASVAVVASAVASVCGAIPYWVMLVVFFTKTIADAVFLASVCRFVGRRELLWYVLPLEIFYVFYIAITGIFSLFARFEWKGRKYNN